MLAYISPHNRQKLLRYTVKNNSTNNHFTEAFLVPQLFLRDFMRYLLSQEFHKARKKGVDKEDLASRNVFHAVAWGLCAAVAPACMLRTLLPLSKTLLKGYFGGVGVLCRFCC